MTHDQTPVEKLEDLPSYEGKALVRDYGYHCRNENLPYRKCRRWMESKVGTNFDEAFSEWSHATWLPPEYRNLAEFCRFADEVKLVDGVLYHNSSFWSWRNPMPYSFGIYIDPETKILKQIKRPKRSKVSYHDMYFGPKSFESYCRILGDGHQLIKHKGIWYEVKYKDADVYQRLRRIESTPQGNIAINSGGNLAWKVTSTKPDPKRPIDMSDPLHSALYIKKQLSSTELKQHKLKND